MTARGIALSFALISVYAAFWLAYVRTRRAWQTTGHRRLFTWLHFKKHWWN